MNLEDVLEELRGVISKDFGGSQKRFAESFDISPAYVSDVLLGKRSPGDKVLAAIGLKKIVIYGKVECDTKN